MVARCTNPTNAAYKDYGGRGIKVYPKWQYDQYSFIRYMLDNLGDRPPGFSLDRIDNSKGYTPGNLRWADRTTQATNRRGRRYVMYKGELMTQAAVARELKISREYVRQMSSGIAKNKYALQFMD